MPQLHPEQKRPNSPRTAFLFLIAACLLSLVRTTTAEPVPPPSIAVLPSGPGETAEALAELLTVELSQGDTWRVVERKRINALLQEQSLNLSDGGFAAAVTAGNLLHAQALLLLTIEPAAGGRLRLRTRLTETSYGLKIWDDRFVLAGKEGAADEQLRQDITSGAVQAWKRFSERDGEPVIVGISSFWNTEPSNRLDWLGDSLVAGLEHVLSRAPGVVLVEREEIEGLLDERSLSAALPKRLTASALLVDGSYGLDPDAGKGHVTVTIRGRAGGKAVAEKAVSGETAQMGGLCTRLAEELLTAVGSLPVSLAMDPASEARLLRAKAERYWKMMERPYAARAADAALALAPRDYATQALLIRTAVYAPWSPRSPRRLLRAMELVPEFVKRDEFVNPTSRERKRERRNIIGTLCGMRFADPVKRARESTPADVEMARATAVSAWNAVRFCPVIRDGDLYSGFLQRTISSCPWWSQNGDEAASMIEWAVSEAIGGSPRRIHALCFAPHLRDFVAAGTPASRKTLTQTFERLLTRLSRHKDPIEAAYGHLSLAYYWQNEATPPNPAKARAALETFFGILTEKALPTMSWQDRGIISSWCGEVYSTLAALPVDTRATCYLRLARACIADGVPKSFSLPAFDSAFGAAKRAGRPAEALALAQLVESKLPTDPRYQKGAERVRKRLRNMCSSLREQFPELGKAEPSDNAVVNAVEVISSRELAARCREAGLRGQLVPVDILRTEHHLAVLCHDPFSGGSERHVATIYLSPADLKITAVRSSTEPVQRMSHRITNGRDSCGPPMHHPTYFTCVQGDDIWLAAPTDGILALPFGMPPRRFTEERGLSSNDLFGFLGIRDGMLYGGIASCTLAMNGLIRMDIATGESRSLISPRGEDAAGDLQRAELKGIAFHPAAPRLLVSVYQRKEGSPLSGLFSYDITTKKATLLSPELDYLHLQQCGKKILAVDRKYGAYRIGWIDPDTGEPQWLYWRLKAHEKTSKAPWGGALKATSVAIREDGGSMLCFGYESGAGMQLHYFVHGRTDPYPLKGEGIPHPQLIESVHCIDGNFYIVTKTGLLLLKGLPTGTP